MNRELLPQEKYYRPQRAAEWRKKAERLEWWQVRLSHAVPPLACGLLLLAVAPLFAGLDLSLALLGYAVPLLLGFLVLPFLLRENVTSYRRHADALEAEHAARYGAPSSGGGQTDALVSEGERKAERRRPAWSTPARWVVYFLRNAVACSQGEALPIS